MRFIRTILCAAALCAVTATASASPANPANGVEYLTLPEVQNTDSGSKVEVTEFFDYACPHCHAFEPVLAEWVKKQGASIVFKRVHITRGQGVLPQQRLYYTLESLGLVEQYHAKVFHAMHVQRQRFASDEAVFAWAEKAGIDRAKFIDAYRSFGMEAKTRRAAAMMEAYKIDHWPILAVGGRYLTSPSLASAAVKTDQTEEDQQQSGLLVLNHLVAKAKAANK
ncbi:thiol:disulfide interchange protein DsbA/DsbL [Massilia sp. RP-1-19]|uniref:Thiol:disulfide interchange protein n=1 Tax=Massilia polaris TaxID=2728846 RepID=A0A848HU75_9BURK|nr:thiol:disulfide interchange protein DsbA/DsbL [Massilia polaris]NML63241.1 thiol:disulfide interchange protein DsbA/DsbL [Massilia polaris]